MYDRLLEVAMPARNPYDRRDRPAFTEHMDAMAFGGDGRPRVELIPGPRALHREDLDAAIASAYTRGRRDEAMESSGPHRDEVHLVQLSAWQEGHDRGEADGWARLVGVIEERFGERLRLLHEMARERIETIDRVGGGASDIAELSALQGLTDLTRDLRAAIEQHFPAAE